MRQADHLIDMGPGAGRHGGRIVAQGTPAQVCRNPDSLTGRYLASSLTIPLPEHRRRIAKTRSITIEGVTTNNIKNQTVHFPLSVLVCVTGGERVGQEFAVERDAGPGLGAASGRAGSQAGSPY